MRPSERDGEVRLDGMGAGVGGEAACIEQRDPRVARDHGVEPGFDQKHVGGERDASDGERRSACRERHRCGRRRRIEGVLPAERAARGHRPRVDKRNGRLRAQPERREGGRGFSLGHGERCRAAFFREAVAADADMGEVGEGLGAQPVAAIYSIISFTYCGIVLTAMLVLAIRQCASDTGIPRLPAALLALGSACGIALCIAVLIMDIAHIVGALDVMKSVAVTYSPLTVLTFAFLCMGFAGQPAVRFFKRRLRRVKTDVLIAQLEPIWFQALRKHPGLSGALPETSRFVDPEARLHRQIVEIRDAMLDPAARLDVSEAEVGLLQRAERHLLGETADTPRSEPTPTEMRTEESSS